MNVVEHVHQIGVVAGEFMKSFYLITFFFPCTYLFVNNC